MAMPPVMKTGGILYCDVITERSGKAAYNEAIKENLRRI